MSRAFSCVCGQPLYLLNSLCVACGREVGYSADHKDLLSIELANLPEGVLAPPGGAFHLARDPGGTKEGLWRHCESSQTPSACNWLVPWALPAPGETTPPMYCLSCSLNRTVPDWSDPVRAENWQEVEMAKRRLVSSLLALGLPVQQRQDPNVPPGLVFDLLSTLPGECAPMTGHDNGLITINVDEADDLTRESVKKSMGENYRTVLGHIRHEVGHYYWDVLIAGSPWLDRFRTLFGDETQDYGEALQRHYAQGAPADWPMHYISAYASAHPWEDWAETWAHYMHMIDGLDTAAGFGVNLGSSAIEKRTGRKSQAAPKASGPGTRSPAPMVPPTPPKAVVAAKAAVASNTAVAKTTAKAAARGPVAMAVTPTPETTVIGSDLPFDQLFDNWLNLTQVMNQMARALGERDLYPFVLAEPARQKLAFVHELIEASAQRA